MKAVMYAPNIENITGYTVQMNVPAHARVVISNLNQYKKETKHKINCGIHIFFVLIYDKQP